MRVASPNEFKPGIYMELARECCSEGSAIMGGRWSRNVGKAIRKIGSKDARGDGCGTFDQVKNNAATLATKSCRGRHTGMQCLAAHMDSSLNTCGRVLRRYLVNVTQMHCNIVQIHCNIVARTLRSC